MALWTLSLSNLSCYKTFFFAAFGDAAELWIWPLAIASLGTCLYFSGFLKWNKVNHYWKYSVIPKDKLYTLTLSTTFNGFCGIPRAQISQIRIKLVLPSQTDYPSLPSLPFLKRFWDFITSSHPCIPQPILASFETR